MRAFLQETAVPPASAAVARAESSSAPVGAAFWRRFALATLVGETAGFAVPALVGALAVSADAPDSAIVPLAVLAGAAEGAILGYAQATVFRAEADRFDRRAYVAATAAAAALAWAAGMSLGAFGGSLSTPLLVAAIPVVAAAILLSIAVAQWLVLRRHFPDAMRWIPANVAAWLGGLVFPFAAMAALDEGSSTSARALVGVVSGLAMAAVVAAVTASAAARLVAGPRPRRSRVGDLHHLPSERTPR